MKRTVSFALMLLFPAAAAAQHASASEKMASLTFLAGEWSGTGWIIMGDGRQSFFQTERVYPTVDGELLVIEGAGYTDETQEHLVHNAYAVLSHDFRNDTYRMHAYRSGGYMIEAEVEAGDESFIWTMTDPQWGMIRYTISLNDEDQWSEIGEVSRDDGVSWFQFFEMTLDRLDSEAAPEWGERLSQ